MKLCELLLKPLKKILLTSAACLPALCATVVFAQERPPATPLITQDPYFSLWSNTNRLTDAATTHWTGHRQAMEGLVRVDGKPFRIMGSDPAELPAMSQTALELKPMHTRYSFADAGVAVDLTFFTPAFLDDMDLLSRPVSYVTWTVRSTDGAVHEVSVLFSAGADMATSYPGQRVVFGRNNTASTHVLSVGSRDQDVLNRSGDDLRIDWGYFRVAVPDDQPAETAITTRPAQHFAAEGNLPAADNMDAPQRADAAAPELAVDFPLGKVGAAAVSRHLLVSYTEGYAIQYLHRDMRPYWERANKPVATMLDEAAQQYTVLEARGAEFDRTLIDDLTRAGGEHYAWICTLAYRQAIAATNLVADVDGSPMLFAKENFSNGDIATVDVLYPSAPMFLLFNPRLLEAQVLPVLEYAALPNRWHFAFAPHDLGQYPLADGQIYGGGEDTQEDQMPVEESGNLLILVDAIAQTEGNTDLAKRFWPQLTQWAEFLRSEGLDPARQLTTDDFAGHVAHNCNLSIKAIEGMAAYADLASRTGHNAEAKRFAAAAKSFAHEWMAMAREGDHYKLAFDSADTWSQKYNLIWDKVLGFDLFPASVRETEIAFYKTKLNTYGLPLDSRADYTKLDWELWTATLATKPADFAALIDPVYKWTNETVSRVPLTDWYDTKTGKQMGFQARSVVGGVFMKALDEPKLAQKWRAVASAKTAPPPKIVAGPQ